MIVYNPARSAQKGMMDALEAVGGADKVGSAHREGELCTGPDSEIMADA
jgi:hypothetical protein